MNFRKMSAALALAGVVSVTSTAHALPIIRGTGNTALIGNDLTDLGNNGVETSYAPPGNLGGFDAVFFASTQAAFNSSQSAFNVFDNLTGGTDNKWCCSSVSQATDGSGQFVGANFSTTLAAGINTSIVLNRFTLTSSNDTPGRDPDVWAIQGSDGGVIWTNIFSTTTNLFSATRNQVLEFSVANGDFITPIGFDQFRLFVDSTAGSGAFALGELELFGNIVTIPEPATAALGATALAGLMLRRRRTV